MCCTYKLKGGSQMKPKMIRMLVTTICIVSLAFTYASVASLCQEPEPGIDEEGAGLSEVEMGSIVSLAAQTGAISLSVDGLGTNAPLGGVIQVEKPPGATVRKAYMAAATSGHSLRILADGDVKIDGADVQWSIITPSNIRSFNHWANVTSIVKPKLDAAPPGRVNFVVREAGPLTGIGGPRGVDGEILAVIFDDPNQTTENTIVLLFGAQRVRGDTFTIGLAEPIGLSRDVVLDLSLGISFGRQGYLQYNQVNVNSTRLTTSAGGQDDGVDAYGALLTVGGLDDGNANPPPFALPGGDPRTDDELYDLRPFVSDGDTSISVVTDNPSEDDNIFFAAFFRASTPPVSQPELWAVAYRWGDPAPGWRWDPFPVIFEGWTELRIDNRGPGDAFNVTATVTDWPINATVPDPHVTVGNIPAAGSAWSADTFITRVDMTIPGVDPCEGVLWRIEYDDSAGVHHVIEGVPQFPPGEGPPPCP